MERREGERGGQRRLDKMAAGVSVHFVYNSDRQRVYLQSPDFVSQRGPETSCVFWVLV